MDEERYTRITLRIPKELHFKLQQSADDTSKSMNAEIVARLQGSFDDTPTKASELEFELIKQRAATVKERNRGDSYVLALMGIAKRLPPDVFADQPHIEEMLAKMRREEKAMTISILDSMLADGAMLMRDLQESIAAGHVKVVADQADKPVASEKKKR